ncbi:MAG: hypothetical protein P8176_07865 [Gammaproteobacteria bacterium]
MKRNKSKNDEKDAERCAHPIYQNLKRMGATFTSTIHTEHTAPRLLAATLPQA